jgi:hypothetical protein
MLYLPDRYYLTIAHNTAGKGGQASPPPSFYLSFLFLMKRILQKTIFLVSGLDRIDSGLAFQKSFFSHGL